MKTAASFPAKALGPGQHINWAVHAVVTEVSRLHHPCPALARAATLPAIRCHRGADAFGGLVDFRHPLPINTKHGDDGWLAIHLAACFGHVGAEYEARLAWVYEREDLWCRIVRDPLSHLEWAGPDVSDPWTALAAAMEYGTFLETGDGMLSRLPIPIRADEVPSLMVDALPAGFGLVPSAILRARKTGMVTVDDGAGAYATHAANAWALAYFIRDAAERVRFLNPAEPCRRRKS